MRAVTDRRADRSDVAYAVRTLSAASGKPVPIISWSAGGLATQWAEKYWHAALSEMTLTAAG